MANSTWRTHQAARQARMNLCSILGRQDLRHMLKYSYWRTVPPARDWVQELDFDFQTAAYGGHGVARYVVHMFYWLCGKSDEFRLIGGASVALV